MKLLNGTSKPILIVLLVIILGFMGFSVYANQDQDMVKPKVSEVHLPKYFNPVQWNADGWVMGVMSDKFLKFQPQTGAWKVLQSNVWSGMTDPLSQVLAFRNGKGLFWVDIVKTGTPALIDNHPDMKIHFWSPDGRYLLYSRVGEWSSEYFIFDRTTGEKKPYLFANVENFLSEPIAWRSFNGKERILFLLRFSKSKTGESGYRNNGFRAEFHLGDLQGQFTPIVQVEDGQFPVFDAINRDGTKLYYHFYSRKEEIWEADLVNKQNQHLYTVPNAKRFSLAGGRGLAFVDSSTLKIMNLKKNVTLYNFTFVYSTILWSPDFVNALLIPSLDSKEQKGFLVHMQR